MNREKNYSKLESNKEGFTLVEVLVVIALIAIISAVTLTAMGIGRTKNNLKTAQREVSSVIKLAQSYALQGKTTPSGETPCGFGFVFSGEDSYKIFYIPSESGMSCEEKNKNFGYRQYINESNSPTLEEYEIKNDIILKKDTNLRDTEIYFTIPHARVYGKTGQPFGGSVITLTNSSGSQDKTITVDERGVIIEEE